MKYIIHFIFLFLATISYGQSTVKGHVVSKNQSALSLLDISLLSQDSILIASAITDDKGMFSIDLAEGFYILMIEEYGALLYEQELSVAQSVDLGKIVLEKENIALKEVVFQGKKKIIEREVDRYIFNVENSIAVLGGDALDALNNTPGVVIQDEKIKLAGKNSVRILVNDKLMELSGDQLTNYLKSISAESIQKIEVITTPPAKYEAEGNSGLINIVLKEAKKNAWNTSLRSSYNQATYASFSEGINFSFQKNKWSLLADVGYNRYNGVYRNEINYAYPDQHLKERLRNYNHYSSYSSLLTLGYEINKNHLIGVQFNGNFNTGYSNGINNTYYLKDEYLTGEYPTNGRNDSDNKFIALNANYVWKMDTLGKKMSVDLDFFNTGNPQANIFQSNLIDYENNSNKWTFSDNKSDQNIKNYTGKIDFYFPLKWAILETGVKTAFSKTTNQLSAYFYDDKEHNNLIEGQDDLFHYDEDIQAIYLSLTKKFSDKWSGKIGIRGEYTQTTTNSLNNDSINKNDYFKLFPTAYLQYKPTDDHSYTISFSRRINRPSFGDMNPNRWYSSPLSYTEGNPFLQPSFSYNIELSYGYKNLINASAYYMYVEDSYTQTIYHNTENLSQIMKRENYANSHYMGATISSSINVTKWWETFNEFSFDYSETKPYIPLYQKDDFSTWGGYLRTTNNFRLNDEKTLSADVNFTYSLPTSGEFSMQKRSNLSLGIKYLAFDKKLTIAFNINDLLKDNYFHAKTFNQNIRQSFNQYYDSHSFRISLSYKFGNNNIQVSKRQSGNEDEINRSR